jgi:hypothetical protein
VPGFHFNIICASILEQKGIYLDARKGWLVDQNGEKMYKITQKGPYKLIEAQYTSKQAVFATSRSQKMTTASIDTWHERMGHVRREALTHLPQAAIGVALSTTQEKVSAGICRTCAMSQNYRQISRVPPERGSYPFERTHFDVVHVEEAFNADRYFLHFYCAYSGYHITYTLPNRAEVDFLQSTSDFLALTERWGYTARILQTDGEKSLGARWDIMIRTRGLTVQTTPPDTQSQNGYAERSGGVISEIARKIHIASQLPVKLWPEFINQATRILNRTPIQRKDWMTPHEIVHHDKPDLSQYRAIGSKAYVLIPETQRQKLYKLRARSLEGWLTGMAASNIYKVWLPRMQRIIASRDVIVDESIKYDKDHIPAPIREPESTTIVINDINDTEIQELLLDQLAKETNESQQVILAEQESQQTSDKEMDANPYPTPPSTASEPSDQQALHGSPETEGAPEQTATDRERLQEELRVEL